MNDLRISLVQGATRWHDPAGNRDYYGELIRSLRGITDLVILPETFTSGFSNDAIANAETMDGATVAWLREQARALRPDLDDMGRVFGMGPVARLRHIVLPQLAPAIAAAARSGVALIWKIVLVVEFLGRSNGVGFKIHLAFSNFDVPRLLAWSLAFVAVMLALDLCARRLPHGVLPWRV